MSNPDPWSQMAAAAPAAAPRYLAYVDTDAVGFDVRMPLPDRCLTCGTAQSLQRMKGTVKVEGSVDTLLARVGGAGVGTVVRAGDRVALSLPFCAACRENQSRAERWSLVTYLSPIWMGILFIALVVFTGHITLPFFGTMILAGAIWIHRNQLCDRYKIQIQRMDGDGIVRIRPVHPDACEAIMIAAGMQAPRT